MSGRYWTENKKGEALRFPLCNVCPDQVFDIGLLLGLVLDVLPEFFFAWVKFKRQAIDFLLVLLDCSKLGFAGLVFGHGWNLLFAFIVLRLSSGFIGSCWETPGIHGLEEVFAALASLFCSVIKNHSAVTI